MDDADARCPTLLVFVPRLPRLAHLLAPAREGRLDLLDFLDYLPLTPPKAASRRSVISSSARRVASSIGPLRPIVVLAALESGRLDQPPFAFAQRSVRVALHRWPQQNCPTAI